ncbi:MAG: recombinase family protein [Hydrogeniiclostridium mannosilyticum]
MPRKRAHVVIMDMPLLDTRVRAGSDRDIYCDLVLQILSYVAETERNNIRQRQAEGIAAAKARGVQFGQQKKPLPPGFEEMRQLWAQGRVSVREAARRLDMSYTTFYRRCTEQSA